METPKGHVGRMIEDLYRDRERASKGEIERQAAEYRLRPDLREIVRDLPDREMTEAELVAELEARTGGSLSSTLGSEFTSQG